MENLQKFESIYDEYHKMVRSLLFRLCGESFLDDLVQEAFLRIWRSLEDFKGDSSIKTWIYTIAHRTAMDHFRTRSTRLKLASQDQVEPPSLVNVADGIEIGQWISKSLAELSDEHRSVLVLCLYEGLSLEECAQVLHVPLGTVKSRLFQSKHLMREKLKIKGVSL